MKTIAAIDQGTTNTRCILFDRTGQPVAQAQQKAVTKPFDWIDSEERAPVENKAPV